MIPDAGLPVANIRGKPVPAVGAEGVVEPQRLRHIRDAVARDGPVGNVEVDLLRPHIENILGYLDSLIFTFIGILTFKLIDGKNKIFYATLSCVLCLSFIFSSYYALKMCIRDSLKTALKFLK